MSPFQSEIEQELNVLLNWWIANMVDEENGGFYGRRDAHNQLFPEAPKAVILNTRILWTFAEAARYTQNAQHIEMADRAFAYLRTYFWDEEQEGLFWMLDAQGQLRNGRKQTYAQAFGIYAFATYYQLTGNEAALSLAKELFALLELKSRDRQHGGYHEAFGRNWEVIQDVRLSEKDANEAKTMNTHLHVLEAYTRLYQAFPHEEIEEALGSLIDCMVERFVEAKTGHLHLFFTEDWQLRSQEISYGHDIEASWLLYEAVEILGKKATIAKMKPLVLQMAAATLQEGLAPDGSVYNERHENGQLDRDKIWWVQAEAMVGFWNAWELTGEEVYQTAVYRIWEVIQDHLRDQEQGEWFWRVDANNQPYYTENKAGPWKAPYHNGRMCLEILRRLGQNETLKLS